MADTKSSDAFDDELLSAYVDGELDEEQRTMVEQRLREDTRAKQLVDELQSLSSSLQSLPREQVGKELRAGVLRQAEEQRALLASRQDQRGGLRRWGWAAMAIAATLLLTIYQPEGTKQEQQLAKAKPSVSGRPVSELRARAKALPAESPAEEASDEVFVIHLTPADSQTGRQRFDELLASNRIDLESESSEDKARLHQEARADASSSPKPAAQPEVVLVEASPVQIESLLRACSADTKHWKSLSFETPANSRLPLTRWRSFARIGTPVAKPSPRLSSSMAEDVAAEDAVPGKDPVSGNVAAKALAVTSQENSSFSRSRGNPAARQKSAAPRRRATPAAGDSERKQTEKGLAPQVAATEGSGGGVGRKQKSSPAASLRVLFVLHPAALPSESEEDFSGKKAAAGK